MEDSTDGTDMPLCEDCFRFRLCRSEADAVAQDPACWEFVPAGFFGDEKE